MSRQTRHCRHHRRCSPLPLVAALCALAPLAAWPPLVAGEAPPLLQPPKPVAPRPGEITEVRIEGTKNVNPDRIRFIVTTRAGKLLDPQALADDVRAIERMGPFTNTKSDIIRNGDGSVTVVFQVTEQPYVSSVGYANLDYFQRSSLEKSVETRAGGWLNPLILENDRRAIEAYFQDKGYRYAAVKALTENDRGNVSVIFDVDLGQEINVGRVVYQGLPDKVFPRQLDATLLNGPGMPYHPELMPFDQGALVRAIQDQGWLDAKLKSTTVENFDYVRPLTDRSHRGPRMVPDGQFNDLVAVVYEVEAGERYHLGSVSFVGNKVATSEQLRAAFGLTDGVPYRRADIDKAVERARRLISNQGYARCDIGVDRGLDLAKRVVNLVLHVEEGDKYRIGRVDIHGNYATKDAVVRRGLQLRPTDLWNDDAIDESKRQLERTGLFKRGFDRPLRISPRFPADRPGEADLQVDVDEDSSGTLSFQVGFSSGYGVFVQVSFGERNFNLQGFLAGLFTGDVGRDWRGAGQNLGVSAQWTGRYTSGDISWTNPHLLDGPYSLSVGYSYSNSTTKWWQEIRSSPSVTVGRSFLRNDLRLSLGYNYTDLKVKEVDGNAPNDALDGEGKYFLNTLSFNQSFDRIDNPRAPTSGYFVSASESITGKVVPASDDFWTYTLRGDYFQPLIEGEQGGVTFLHFNAKWTQLFPLGDDDVAPFYQRIYDGGPSPRHRGFEFNRLTPTEINRNGAKSYTGGTTNALLSAEFSVPVQDNNDGIRLALFADWGNVWAAEESIKLDDMRTAVGFGVRFPIQIPVSLDFAWLVDRKDGDSATQIQFTMGQFHY